MPNPPLFRPGHTPDEVDESVQVLDVILLKMKILISLMERSDKDTVAPAKEAKRLLEVVSDSFVG